jgi:hypothetical protein
MYSCGKWRRGIRTGPICPCGIEEGGAGTVTAIWLLGREIDQICAHIKDNVMAFKMPSKKGILNMEREKKWTLWG